MRSEASDALPYKMRDLCEASGLERQAIHFYIQRGLLPPGQKTGRNTARYGDEHLERLRLIRKLKEERFLPLKAIKAILDGHDGAFSPEQRGFLSQVKARLGDPLQANAAAPDFISIDSAVEATGVEREDIEEAISLGTLAASDDRSTISTRDVWMLELFAEMRNLGFTKERGFRVADVAIYEAAMSQLFKAEMSMLTARLTDIPPGQVAGMIERSLPVIHAYLVRSHTDRVRDFFSTLPGDAPATASASSAPISIASPAQSKDEP